ncbi:hypothetical protein BGZ65_006384, partial [Modicella reniformis]
MATAPARLDILSEVTELEQIPIPYKTLYHALVLKNDMPIDLMRERHRSGSEQLLTWIQAALKLVETVASTSTQYTDQQQEEKDEDDDEELEIEIQDVVSGFGQYEPTIESTIEILLHLEESIIQRVSESPEQEQDQEGRQSPFSPSPEIETIQEQWERLQGIIGDLDKSIREHQRLRDGIQNASSLTEHTRQAIIILEKCLADIASDRQRTNELAEVASHNGSTSSLSSHDSATSLRGRSRSSGVDSNDILELESRYEELALKVDTFQKMYPECARSNKAHKSKSRNSKQQESGTIADKKQVIYKLYKDLLKDWHSLRHRKEQLWRDLQECDRWRTRIEKMTTKIEEMLAPVEIFHKVCVNLLARLDGKDFLEAFDEMAVKITSLDITQSPLSMVNGKESVNLEMLWATLQQLDEKQTVMAPAIENMFWVQEGELQHRSKHTLEASTSVSSPASADEEYSPLYPTLDMLERQKRLKSRWSVLKTSLDIVGTKLQDHHTLIKEKANMAQMKKEETAEDRTVVGSVDGKDWNSTTGVIQKKGSIEGIAPNWASKSHRFLRNKIVPAIARETATVKKFMLVKSDKPEWSKPRPWCPSANPASPGMPGFPMQTSQWGYYLLTKSQNEGDFGTVIATPAPVPTEGPPSAPVKPSPLKNSRPPFSPAGTRKFMNFGKPLPTRSESQRSISVAGDFRNNARSMTPMTASGDVMGWERTLRQSASFSLESKQPAPFRFSSSGSNMSRSTVNTPAARPNSRLKRAASMADGLGDLKPLTSSLRRHTTVMGQP